MKFVIVATRNPSMIHFAMAYSFGYAGKILINVVLKFLILYQRNKKMTLINFLLKSRRINNYFSFKHLVQKSLNADAFIMQLFLHELHDLSKKGGWCNTC